MTTEDKVKAIYKELFNLDVSPTDPLIHGDMDSLDITDVRVYIEVDFETDISDHDFSRMSSVGDLVKYLEDEA